MPVLVNPYLSFGVGAPSNTYVGYNTIGGSTSGATRHRVYAKQVTLAVDSLIVSIGAYLLSTSDNRSALSVAVFEDNSGTPRYVLGASGDTCSTLSAAPGSELLLEDSVGTATARWVHRPLGLWCPSGTYWLAVQENSNVPSTIYADSGGGDRHYSPGSDWFADWGFYSPTTTTNRYSIRAEVMT